MGSDRGFLERVRRNRDERRKKIPGLLRKAREELRLTQAQVAEVLDWRQSDVSKMEAGERTPDVVDLENFALMCGKQLDHFATWKMQLEEDRPNQSVTLKADEFRFRLDGVRKQAANRRFYRKRRVKMTSEQIAAVDEARRKALATQK